jgi:hypothetical protein
MKNMSSSIENISKSKTRGQTPVKTNLGDKTNLFPLFFMCIVFILTFDFIPNFGQFRAQ